MSEKKNLIEELSQKRAELDDLYLKIARNDLKETHLISNKKKEIARILTEFHSKGE